MKVRVLWPSGWPGDGDPPRAGEIIEVGDKEAKDLVESGVAEKVNVRKSAKVERATAAPGEKR